MVLPKYKPANPIKPGLWLGFFFWLTMVVGVAVIIAEYPWIVKEESIDNRFFRLDGSKWLAFLGGWGAILGALTTARITLKNAIKQHTMTTLLQMRMSETYMQRARKVSERYLSSNGEIYILDTENIRNPKPEDCIPELLYVLNYLEFISSAIRYGDLDENLMNESLRGMLCNNYECARALIHERRTLGQGRSNPLLFEHIEWLYLRWFDEKYQRKHLSLNQVSSGEA